VAKVRQDAWGEDLPEEVRRELYAFTKAPTAEEKAAGRPWLRDFFRDVAPLLEARGIAAPSRAGWYRFLGRMREEESAARIISVETSKRIAQGIQRADVDCRLAADMFTALSVDAAAQGNGEAAKILGDAAAKYAAAALAAEKLSLDRAAQKTKEDALALAREKFEAAEKREAAARATVQDEALSPEEQVARMKEIFGIR
jgi:hypothetical protein